MSIYNWNGILAQAAPAAPAAGQQQGSPFGLLVPMILVFVIMYFMMIRPQQKRAKQQAELLKTLKSGDRVVTASGLVGVVISVKDKAVPPTVSIHSADAKFEVTKSSVTEILQGSDATEV